METNVSIRKATNGFVVSIFTFDKVSVHPGGSSADTIASDLDAVIDIVKNALAPAPETPEAAPEPSPEVPAAPELVSQAN